MFSGRRVGSKPVKMKLTLGGGHESTQQAPTAESSTTGLSEKSTDESVHTTATSTVTAETQQTDEGSKKLTFSLSMSTNRTVKTTRKNLFSSPAKRAADSDEEDDTAAEQVILLTGFEDNKAQSANPEPERGPLVIPALPNRDWRSARRALQTATKDMLAANQGPTTGAVERITHDQEQYGLQLPRKRSKLETDADTSTVTVRTEEASTSPEPTEAAATAAAASPTSLDEQAVKALLEEAKQHIDGPAETSSESERSKLVLPMGGDASNMTHLTSADRARIEHEAFKADLEACPDEATLDEYEQVPIEEFGAALLRGMGWKDGEGVGRGHRHRNPPIYVNEQRPRLLGLGAKPKPIDPEDIVKKKGCPRLPMPPPLP